MILDVFVVVCIGLDTPAEGLTITMILRVNFSCRLVDSLRTKTLRSLASGGRYTKLTGPVTLSAIGSCGLTVEVKGLIKTYTDCQSKYRLSQFQ